MVHGISRSARYTSLTHYSSLSALLFVEHAKVLHQVSPVFKQIETATTDISADDITIECVRSCTAEVINEWMYVVNVSVRSGGRIKWINQTRNGQ